MKPENLLHRVDDFFSDKNSLTYYLTSLEAGGTPQQKDVDEFLKLDKKWRNYPSFYRSLKDNLKQLQMIKESIGPGRRDAEIVAPNALPRRHSYLTLVKGNKQSAVEEGEEGKEKETEEVPETAPIQREIKWKKPANLTLSTKQAKMERKKILEEEKKFDLALEDILENKLAQTIEFGQQCSVDVIADYLKGMFGEELYFDSLLSITQQYAIADAPIVNDLGMEIGRTGFNLSFFGDPGTGKTFAIKDMILGRPDFGVKAHGLTGRNRFCGSITAARFVRMAEAYQDKKFSFIVPEFDDWFKYKGMVNTLKAAMEGSQVEYENNNEIIGPYTFGSFLSVNYNTKVSGDEFQATISDPHFKAIEDRMLNNLHKMTDRRYQALARSKENLEKGKIKMDLAETLQNHLMLVYAIQTEHPLVKNSFPPRAILNVLEFHERIEKAREGILYLLKEKSGNNESSIPVPFSPRIEKRALQLAAAMSLPNYFRAEKNSLNIPISQSAINYALRFFVNEASIRSMKIVDAKYILKEIGLGES